MPFLFLRGLEAAPEGLVRGNWLRAEGRPLISSREKRKLVPLTFEEKASAMSVYAGDGAYFSRT